jgi:hypothetical protein
MEASESSESEVSLSMLAGNSSNFSLSASSDEGVCSICSKVQPDDTLVIKYEQPAVMCDKCGFVNGIVKGCISGGILTKSGASHDIEWRAIDKPDRWAIIWGVDEGHAKDEFILRETNFWDDFNWMVWAKDGPGQSGCKFEAFISPGKLFLLMQYMLYM